MLQNLQELSGAFLSHLFPIVYKGCVFIPFMQAAAGRRGDFSVLPVRELQDLDEKARGQVQTKGPPSIRMNGWKGLGVDIWE